MRTTKQTDFEKPTQVPVAGFETDFIDASHDTLGEFCLSNFPSNARIQPNYFGIMDERSMDDSTLLVVKWELWAERKDPNNDFDLENKEGWQTVRVRFGGAADFITRVEYLPLEEHLSGDDVLDEEGVYKLLG